MFDMGWKGTAQKKAVPLFLRMKVFDGSHRIELDVPYVLLLLGSWQGQHIPLSGQSLGFLPLLFLVERWHHFWFLLGKPGHRCFQMGSGIAG